MEAPVRYNFDEQIIVGRSSSTDSFVPDVDLSAFDAASKGVSRQHLQIFSERDQIYLVDLDSPNGSFLNGERMAPNQAYVLVNGDEIHLGNLPMQIHIIRTPFMVPTDELDSESALAAAYRGNGELILIVESDSETANNYKNMLEDAGYRTRIAPEVLRAIRMYNQERPSAVLMELLLSDLNGLEFCRYVRRDVVQNTIPVVVASSTNSDQMVSEAMHIGADAFLKKPVPGSEILKVIGGLLQQHAGGQVSDRTRNLIGTAPLQRLEPETRHHAVVLFVEGHGDAPLTVQIPGTISLGRKPAAGSSQAHLDLGSYGADNSGVSRLHMFMHYKSGQFFAEDAGSTNGTYCNGNPLDPGQRYRVNNGDEIRLGRLRLYVYFLDQVMPED
jgi:pSer/pThr/pTyr-binding forkhead associated (FHA) protein/CheY-like chemotaxis protein